MRAQCLAACEENQLLTFMFLTRFLNEILWLYWLAVGGRKGLRRILIGVNSPCRSVCGLALAGHHLLHPTHTADAPDVLHAGDTALPSVQGKEAWGRGGAAIPARTRCSHWMGVCPHWRCVWRAGESTMVNPQGQACSWFSLRWWNVCCLPAGIQFHLIRSEGPWCLQAADNWRHADGIPADDRHQWHHVLRWEHFWTGTFSGEESFNHFLCVLKVCL